MYVWLSNTLNTFKTFDYVCSLPKYTIEYCIYLKYFFNCVNKFKKICLSKGNYNWFLIKYIYFVIYKKPLKAITKIKKKSPFLYDKN